MAEHLPGDRPFHDVLTAAQAGDAEAFRTLYAWLAPPVVSTLRARGARDVDDLVSETFLAVFTGLRRFKGDAGDLRAWAMTIAHRRWVDEQRRNARRPVRSGVEASEDAGVEPSAEELGLASIGEERVRALLGLLSADQREVLLLRILGDLTVEQVARVVGKRVGAVKALQRRGLATLRRHLDETAAGEGVPL